jgi:hypothetical protein
MTPWPWSEPSSAFHRVPTTGRWSISVPRSFRLIDNGDSWQAHEGERVVYVSSIAVEDAEGSPTAPEALCVTAARAFGEEGERHSHSAEEVRGVAEIRREADHWQLKGFMCAAGTVATCLIDYLDPRDNEWALAVWRSLEHA